MRQADGERHTAATAIQCVWRPGARGGCRRGAALPTGVSAAFAHGGTARLFTIYKPQAEHPWIPAALRRAFDAVPAECSPWAPPAGPCSSPKPCAALSDHQQQDAGAKRS